MVSIRPGYLTFYSEYCGDGSASSSRSEQNELPISNSADGLISYKAQRRLSQAVDWMLCLCGPKKLYPNDPTKNLTFKVNFVTLTLSSPQIHSDNEIKQKLLQPFLDTLRKTWKCKHYLWRAEPQKNGNIHFHLVTDVYIPMWKLRVRWNDIQNKLGYVDRWKTEKKVRQPPSTEVKSVKNIRKLGAYLAKYCAKNPEGAMYTALQEENGELVPCYNPSEALKIYPAKAGKFRSIGGNLWGLSYSLSKIRSAVACVHDIKDSSLHQLWKVFGKEAKEYAFHTCIYVPVSDWMKHVTGDLFAVFANYVLEYRKIPPIRELSLGS